MGASAPIARRRRTGVGARVHLLAISRRVDRSRISKKMAGKPGHQAPTNLSGHHSASDFVCRFTGVLISNIALTNIIGSQNNIGIAFLLATVRAHIAPEHRFTLRQRDVVPEGSGCRGSELSITFGWAIGTALAERRLASP
jgi:hypothetical protein